MTRAREAGFTLLEILVALTVLGFIMLGLGQGLRFGLSAWSTQARTIAARDELGAAERLLRDVIARIEPNPQGEPPRFRGLPGAMQFRTRLPMAAEAFAFRTVDAALGVDADRRLVLRLLPNPTALAGAGARPVIAETLLNGVDRLELAYWRPARRTEPAAWVRDWDEQALPALVRLRIAFAAGDRRHWPDIVAAPVRDPALD